MNTVHSKGRKNVPAWNHLKRILIQYSLEKLYLTNASHRAFFPPLLYLFSSSLGKLFTFLEKGFWLFWRDDNRFFDGVNNEGDGEMVSASTLLKTCCRRCCSCYYCSFFPYLCLCVSPVSFQGGKLSYDLSFISCYFASTMYEHLAPAKPEVPGNALKRRSVGRIALLSFFTCCTSLIGNEIT